MNLFLPITDLRYLRDVIWYSAYRQCINSASNGPPLYNFNLLKVLSTFVSVDTV